MYIISYFFLAIAGVFDILLSLYKWAIIIRIIMNLINSNPFNPFVKFIQNITEPPLKLLRNLIPTVFGKIDFSPIIIFICIIFLKTFIINTLTQTARSLM